MGVDASDLKAQGKTLTRCVIMVCIWVRILCGDRPKYEQVATVKFGYLFRGEFENECSLVFAIFYVDVAVRRYNTVGCDVV